MPGCAAGMCVGGQLSPAAIDVYVYIYILASCRTVCKASQIAASLDANECEYEFVIHARKLS